MSGPLGSGSSGGGGGGGGGGVTSLVAGSGISVSSSTGAVTVTSSGPTLISRVTLSSTAAAISLNSIPSGYKHLEIIYSLRSTRTTASLAIARVVLNNDQGSNYIQNTFTGTNLVSPAIPSATCVSGFGVGRLFLHNAGDSTNMTDVVQTFNSTTGTVYRATGGNVAAANWNSTARVTDVALIHLPVGDLFVVDSTVELWGYP